MGSAAGKMQFALNKLAPLGGIQRHRHGIRLDEQAGGFGPPLTSTALFRLQVQRSLWGFSAVLSHQKLCRAVGTVMLRVVFTLLKAQVLLL